MAPPTKVTTAERNFSHRLGQLQVGRLPHEASSDEVDFASFDSIRESCSRVLRKERSADPSKRDWSYRNLANRVASAPGD